MRVSRRPRATPRAYRKLDAKNWTVGVSAGAILLVSSVLVLRRHALHQIDRTVARAEREEAIDRDAVRIPPGEPVPQEELHRESEGYTLVVHPFDGPCKAAIARVGDAGASPSREEIVRILKANAVEVDRGGSRTLDGMASPGRWAWAVWHEGRAPQRIWVHYQDTRRP